MGHLTAEPSWPEAHRLMILAIIPARGSSKSIKGKNTRLLRQSPLVQHVLGIARASSFIEQVLLTSDDSVTLDLAHALGGTVTRTRPAELAGDDVTLDPVVHDALVYAEQMLNQSFDVIVTLQPTSPTLTAKTLDKALEVFIASDYDSCISVVEDSHLRWEIRDDEPVPVFAERLNRQWLPKTYRETGGFVISRRGVVSERDRLGKRVMVFPVSESEAIDIDSPLDWLMAEAVLARRRFALAVTGNERVGTGHLHRTLTLADMLLGQDVQVLAYQCDPKGLELIGQRGYTAPEAKQMGDLLARVDEFQPHIVINDILDTQAEYVQELRNRGHFVVNFEDLGPGSDSANVVFNALYELSSPPAHHRYGAQYVCLNQHFLLSPPAPWRSAPRTLLVTFGGVDENNLTTRALEMVPNLFEQTPLDRCIVVLGPAFAHVEALADVMGRVDSAIERRIEIVRSVNNMAQLMRDVDVAVTSNGRTVYELAAMGIPGVTIAQNDRETLHLFSRYSKGFEYLGIACNVGAEALCDAVSDILNSPGRRERMRQALLGVELRKGAERVKREMLDSYWRWHDEGDHAR